MATTTAHRSNAAQGLLQGLVAAVTGAASGIGAAIAQRFAAEGGRVALLARREGRLRELAEQINSRGGTALPIAPTSPTSRPFRPPPRRSPRRWEH